MNNLKETSVAEKISIVDQLDQAEIKNDLIQKSYASKVKKIRKNKKVVMKCLAYVL